MSSSFFKIKPKVKGQKKPYPIDTVPPCGDKWCLNGPPGTGPQHTTYFLCEECSKLTPDAIDLGYATPPTKMKKGTY